MHRHMRRIGDQPAFAVKQGAGKIQPFLHVDRMGDIFQHRPHLFGDGHEQIVENFQHDGIGIGADGFLPGERRGAGQDQVAKRVPLRLPADLHNIGAVIFQDHGGAGDRCAGGEVIPMQDGGLDPPAATKDPPGFGGRARAVGGRCGPVGQGFAPAPGLGAGGLDNQRPVRADKAEMLFMQGFKVPAHLLEGAIRHLQRAVAAPVFDLKGAFHPDVLNPLLFKLVPGGLRQPVHGGLNFG